MREGFAVRGSVRTLPVDARHAPLPSLTYFPSGDIGPSTDWSGALDGIDTVIHLANRAHVMRDAATDPLETYRCVNVAGTQRLAEQAAAAGVRRFIYISSLKVNGEQTSERAFYEGDTPDPGDPYGISKWEAEQQLNQLASRAALEVVVLRPPLMYGPGVKANFLRLMQMVDRGIPLPLSAVRNQRSLLYVGNLVDALLQCIQHPGAAGQTFLISDGEDVSTPDLICRIANALARPVRLISVPVWLLRKAGQLTRKTAEINRLLGSLTVDSRTIRQSLGWTPPYTMSQGLQETAHWFYEAKQRR